MNENSAMNGLLVTGSHRSGTTWVGNVLNASGQFRLIYEPFNIEICNRSTHYPFRYWFTHYRDVRDLTHLEECLQKALSCRFIRRFPPYYNLTFRARYAFGDYLKNFMDRASGKIPLVKDPLALFSADWLADRFGLNVVVMVRHPLAFSASIKKAGWKFPFEHLLSQNELMKSYFQPFREKIIRIAETDTTPFEQSILLWNLIHTVIKRYKEEEQSNWLFVRHEDLTQNPHDGFREICRKFGYHYNEGLKDNLEESQRGSSRTEKNVRYQPRDPHLVLNSWKNRLSPNEIERVLKNTEQLCEYFYPDNLACFQS